MHSVLQGKLRSVSKRSHRAGEQHAHQEGEGQGEQYGVALALGARHHDVQPSHLLLEDFKLCGRLQFLPKFLHDARYHTPLPFPCPLLPSSLIKISQYQSAWRTWLSRFPSTPPPPGRKLQFQADQH